MSTLLLTSKIRIIVGTPEILTGSGNSSIVLPGWELNSSVEARSPAPPNEDDNGKIPVIGYPGPLFTAIHVGALTSLSLSIAVVTILLIYLCGFSGSVKEHARGTTAVNGRGAVAKLVEGSFANRAAQRKKKKRLSFWKWNVGERYVVYLSVCDLCQGVSHSLDHAYMFYAKDNPPDRICAVFAFFLHNFILTQWFIILATALSACSLIVFGRKMSLGRYDWRLMAFALGIPTVISVIAASRGLLGAGGAWCFIKYGAPSWRLYAQIVSSFQLTFFGLVGVAYGAIWIKIQRTTNLMKGSKGERYQSSAKVMMIFVAVFVLQWWTYTLYTVWNMIVDPPPIVFILAVIFINLGGIYNCIAYTIIRRKLQQQKRQNAVTNNVDNITSSTCTDSAGANSRSPSASLAVQIAAGSSVPEVLEDVLSASKDVLDDSGFASKVRQSSRVPEVLGVPEDVLSASKDVLDDPGLVSEIPQSSRVSEVLGVPEDVLSASMEVLDDRGFASEIPQSSGDPEVLDVLEGVLSASKDILGDHGLASNVPQALSVPTAPGVSQIAQLAGGGQGQGLDFDVGETLDVDQTEILILHI